jgi:hypothetical protein
MEYGREFNSFAFEMPLKHTWNQWNQAIMNWNAPVCHAEPENAPAAKKRHFSSKCRSRIE